MIIDHDIHSQQKSQSFSRSSDNIGDDGVEPRSYHTLLIETNGWHWSYEYTYICTRITQTKNNVQVKLLPNI